MAHVFKFNYRRRARLFASLGSVALVPPTVCWLALVLLVAGLRPADALLRAVNVRGGPAAEVLILLICPLAAVALGFAAIKRVPRGRRGAELWCWSIIGAGLMFAVGAVLATLRPA
jgi:hypothetical protein